MRGRDCNEYLMKMLAAGAAFAALAAIVSSVQTASAQAATRCPGDGTPPPGSTINGGLEVSGGVDGYCELHNVTVNGGIYVPPTPDAMLSEGHWNGLNLIGSTVQGGVRVGDHSEVDANIDFSTGGITSEPTTINGGLTLDHVAFVTVANTTIGSGVTVNGGGEYSILCALFHVPPEFCFGNYIFCGVTIDGNVSENDINTSQAFLGDPEEQFFTNSVCTGNTVQGSVFMHDSNFIRSFDGEPSEIEGDTITGSVHLDHSTLELSGNTVGGSLLCTNGTVIHPPAPYELPGGNTVRGQDTCD
jgi:hypothetical protein